MVSAEIEDVAVVLAVAACFHSKVRHAAAVASQAAVSTLLDAGKAVESKDN